MKQIPGNLTPSQLKVYEVVQRIRMAWVALFFALGLFSIGFLAFLYSVFFLDEHTVPKIILGGIDSLLGWCLKIVYSDLFPGGAKTVDHSKSSNQS